MRLFRRGSIVGVFREGESTVATIANASGILLREGPEGPWPRAVPV